MIKSATISPDGLYRYDLIRRWAPGGLICVFVGLNPSTADAELDDPTIRRCVGFAKSWGYNALVMVNAYAFRSTDPRVMKKSVDPIGPLNDGFLQYWRDNSACVIAAWGTNISVERQIQVREIYPRMQILKITKDGFPSHPLYLHKYTQPQVWV